MDDAAFESPEFDDQFSSCARCYATLCIYHDTLEPAILSDVLGVNPTRQKIADARNNSLSKTPNGWFLTTNNVLISRDIRAHVWHLLEKFKSQKHLMVDLHLRGYESRVLCFWESQSGNGGPVLDVATMATLAEFGWDIHFDIWF